LNLPNYLTVLRILLVPFFFTFVIYSSSERPTFRFIALAIFVVAVLSDALDGAIARHLKERTKLGTFLDPLADKLLLVSGFLAITFSNAFIIKPPTWIIILIVFRDLFIIGGLGIILLTTNKMPVAPNVLGKVTTFFQMLTIITVLISLNHAKFVWYAAAGLTIISTGSYLFRGIRLLNAPGESS